MKLLEKLSDGLLKELFAALQGNACEAVSQAEAVNFLLRELRRFQISQYLSCVTATGTKLGLEANRFEKENEHHKINQHLRI